MSVICVGTMAFDAIETPFGKVDRIVGGSGTYVAYAAGNFVTPVQQISIVGYDFPQEEMDELKGRGIELDGVEIVKDKKSFFWSGKYHLDMNSRDTLVTDLNVLEDFNPIVPDSYQGAEFLMLGNLMPKLQLSVINQLKERPKLIVMDTMNFWMDIAMDDLKEVLKKVDVLLVNDAEARQLSGELSLVKAARLIMDMGPKFLIIKKGEHGALLFHENHVFFAPALPLEEVFDPTGAGDTFAGGFIGYLAKTKDISFENMKLLLGCAVFVLLDIGMRQMGSSFGGTDEISGYVMAIATAWGMGFTLIELGHVRIDLLRSRVASRGRAFLDLVAMLALALTVSLIAIRGWPVLARSLENGSRANTPLETPLALVQGPWLAGWIWFAIVAWLTFAAAVMLVARKDFAASEAAVGTFGELDALK